MADDDAFIRDIQRTMLNFHGEMAAEEADDDQDSEATRPSDGHPQTEALSRTLFSTSAPTRKTKTVAAAGDNEAEEEDKVSNSASDSSWVKQVKLGVQLYLDSVDGWATLDLVEEARAAERDQFYARVKNLARAWLDETYRTDSFAAPEGLSLVKNPTHAEVQDFVITWWRQASKERWLLPGQDETLPPSLVRGLSELGFIHERLPPVGANFQHALLGGASLLVMFRNCCFLHECCRRQGTHLDRICILAGAGRKAQLDSGDALDRVLKCAEYQEHMRHHHREHPGLVLDDEETEKSLADKVIAYFQRLYPDSHWERATTLRASKVADGEKVWFEKTLQDWVSREDPARGGNILLVHQQPHLMRYERQASACLCRDRHGHDRGDYGFWNSLQVVGRGVADPTSARTRIVLDEVARIVQFDQEHGEE